MKHLLARWNARIAMGSLKNEIEMLRLQLAQAAQSVYDEWDQDEEGIDEVFGSGGICDQVAEKMGDVINDRVGDITTHEGGQEGDDHSWVVVIRSGDPAEGVGVDIPPGVYETGGGYSWSKVPGVMIRPDDVEIFEIDPDGFVDAEEW